jgi:hypothetical protein
VTKEKQKKFLHRVQQLKEAFRYDRVINIDETDCSAIAAGFWTWADTGSEGTSKEHRKGFIN